MKPEDLIRTLQGLQGTDRLHKNTVGNLIVVRDGKHWAWIDLIDGELNLFEDDEEAEDDGNDGE